MLHDIAIAPKNRLRTSNKKAVRWQCLNPQVRLLSDGQTKELVKHSCGYCVGCQRNQLNDLTGRLGAEALTCAYVDFVTLTYDRSHSIEAAMGSLIRVQEHAQNWQKRMRRHEEYQLQKYNKGEIEKAHNEGREPQLVDTTGTLKFFTVPEIGKGGTCHFHVLVFYGSHVPVPDNVLARGDPDECQGYVKRVYDMPVRSGPVTAHLPEGANDPKVIDFRVRAKKERWGRKTGGNQHHWSWEYGFSNWQRVTHEMNTTLPEPPRKPRRELGESIMYVQKYLRKYSKDMASHSTQKVFDDEDWSAYKLGLRKGVVRSQSRKFGHQYAQAVAKNQALHGVEFDPLYQLTGFEMKISPKAETTHKRRFESAGASSLVGETLTDRRRTFSMRGSMLAAAVASYIEIREQRGATPRSDHLIRFEHETITKAHRAFLDSPQAAIARMYSPSLPDTIKPVRAYEYDELGRLQIGVHGNADFSKEIQLRDAKERLEERREHIEHVQRMYEAVLSSLDTREKFQKVQSEVGQLALADLLTEPKFKNRPKEEVAWFNRAFDVEHVSKVLDELADKASDGDEKSFHLMEYIEDRMSKMQKVAFGLPRHDVWHDQVHSHVLWHWIWTCDDYDFSAMRDQLIDRMTVDEVGSAKLVVNPTGERFVVRRCYADCKIMFEGKPKLLKDWREVYASRKLTEEQYSEWFKVSLRSPLDRARILSGPEPLRHLSINGPA